MTYDSVKSFIESEGCKLISDDYVRNSIKLEIACPKGHVFFMTFKDFKKGYRCSKCAKNYRPSFKEVEDVFNKEGYTLFSTEYKNAKSKLKVGCPNNHKYECTLDSFKRGIRCRTCFLESKNKLPKLSYDETVNYVESFGYEFLSDNYKGVKQIAKFKCPQGHVYETVFGYFQSGHRCPDCFGNKKLDYDTVSKFINNVNGYNLSSDHYVNAHHPMIINCNTHGNFVMSWNSFQSGHRCPKCSVPRGENHPMWNGGSAIKHYLRGLLRGWKKESLIEGEYKCFITGESGKLCVHHPYNFHKIVTDTLEELKLDLRDSIVDYSEDEIRAIGDKFLEYHQHHKGVLISEDLHILFHSLYGMDNNFEQLLDFKRNYNERKLEGVKQ